MALTAFKKTGLTGGTISDLDGVDGAALVDGNFAFVNKDGIFYFYLLDDDLGAGESSPGIIVPDTNPGTKCWVLKTPLSVMLKGADVASATALPVIYDGNYFDVTGTTTITSINAIMVGNVIKLHFDAALILTHNATDLILPGAANITTATGDEAEFIEYAAGDYRCTCYTKSDGTSVVGTLSIASPVASTSGTEIDFTSIPSGVKKISINFTGVSTDGTSNFLIQLGDSGGIETTGYAGGVSLSTSAELSTAGFILTQVVAAAVTYDGTITLTLENASAFTWCGGGNIRRSSDGAIHVSAGSKSLSAELTQLRITMVNGSDTFDAGEINISYE